MTTIWTYAILSVLAVSLISLLGVFVLGIKTRFLNNMLFMLVSFAAGAMLGDVFIHLLPQMSENGFDIYESFSVLGGIVILFVVEKIIHWHHCHQAPSKTHVHPFAIINLLGDTIHNFIDGLIIGASYLVSIPVGLATTIAVLLHEIPQEVSDFAVLLQGGFSKARALFFNFLVAMTAVVGTVVALFIGLRAETFVMYLIPFAAGSFIYIAGTDLIPEINKEVRFRKSIVQLIFFLSGIGVMSLLLFLE